jgi:glucose-6-phosphate 1-dehydrogenase
MSLEPLKPPLIIFLIGTTGDLARAKILKAIYKLHTDGLLPQNFTLLGNSRKDLTDHTYRDFCEDIIQPSDADSWNAFALNLFYVAGDASNTQTLAEINNRYIELSKTRECGNQMWYLATLPKLYAAIVKNINAVGFCRNPNGWTKILLEKPFGTDTASAKEFNQQLLEVFKEEDIYRIDHFLGKETVQNILAFRFANGIFEYLWSKDYIDHIQVTTAESVGIEGRELFYDQTGAVRDVVQNHALQMLATMLMDEPATLKAADIRFKRSQFIESLHFPDLSMNQWAVFGQFDGYTQSHPDLAHSKTETAVALVCASSTPQWHGVPIYIRAGKKLDTIVPKLTEISIVFKEPKNQMFTGMKQAPDRLMLRIQPNEGIVLYMSAKKPGLKLGLESISLDFCYRNQFQMDLIEAYQKLIYDAVTGDTTLFPQASGVEASWTFVEPLLEHMRRSDFTPEIYSPNTWGPSSFHDLLSRDKRYWFTPDPAVCRI